MPGGVDNEEFCDNSKSDEADLNIRHINGQNITAGLLRSKNIFHLLQSVTVGNCTG